MRLARAVVYKAGKSRGVCPDLRAALRHWRPEAHAAQAHQRASHWKPCVGRAMLLPESGGRHWGRYVGGDLAAWRFALPRIDVRDQILIALDHLFQRPAVHDVL